MSISIRSTGIGEAKFERRSSSRDQYGHVRIGIEPRAEGAGVSVYWEATAEMIPYCYRNAVEKGVHTAIAESPSHIENALVRIMGGSYDRVASNDLSFELAALTATRKAIEDAQQQTGGKN